MAIEPGWNNNNYHDKTDPAIVARFTDAKTGKVIFRYAPRFNDIQFWVTIFEAISKYELTKRARKTVHGTYADKEIQKAGSDGLARDDSASSEEIRAAPDKARLASGNY